MNAHGQKVIRKRGNSSESTAVKSFNQAESSKIIDDPPDPSQPAIDGLVVPFRPLQQVIEIEIIPRLALSHRDDAPLLGEQGARSRDRQVDDAAIDDFVQLVRKSVDDQTDFFITDLIRQGASLDSIYLNLLAPAARRFGDMWIDDLVDFTEVTLAVGKLQRLLHRLDAASQALHPGQATGFSVQLVPAPQEQHTFGLSMVAEFFRGSGWEVVFGEYNDLRGATRTGGNPVDVVGWSIGSEIHLEKLASEIANLRRSDPDGNIGVLVGGSLVVERPELVSKLGADAMAIDGREAVDKAFELVSALADERGAKGFELGA